MVHKVALTLSLSREKPGAIPPSRISGLSGHISRCIFWYLEIYLVGELDSFLPFFLCLREKIKIKNAGDYQHPEVCSYSKGLSCISIFKHHLRTEQRAFQLDRLSIRAYLVRSTVLASHINNKAMPPEVYCMVTRDTFSIAFDFPILFLCLFGDFCRARSYWCTTEG